MENWKKEYEEQQLKYGKECQAELKADKNFPLAVTPQQAVVILEPNHAPENFYCVGEISHAQALSNYKERLKNAGFNPMYVKIIVKYILG